MSIEYENLYICEAVYGGNVDDFYSVISNDDKKLHCNKCFDKSLYHNSLVYWDENTKDLLCIKCYKKDKIRYDDYIEVLTQY